MMGISISIFSTELQTLKKNSSNKFLAVIEKYFFFQQTPVLSLISIFKILPTLLKFSPLTKMLLK